jgi:hypothetical protein
VRTELLQGVKAQSILSQIIHHISLIARKGGSFGVGGANSKLQNETGSPQLHGVLEQKLLQINNIHLVIIGDFRIIDGGDMNGSFWRLTTLLSARSAVRARDHQRQKDHKSLRFVQRRVFSRSQSNLLESLSGAEAPNVAMPML